MSVPDYIEIDSDATKEDIRSLLEEARDRRVNGSSLQMLVTLALIEPQYRLALNLKKVIGILAERKMSADIMLDGLTDSEKNMLVDLDRCHLSPAARCAARCLLNVKERWLLRKSVSGLFSAARCSSAVLTLEYDNDEA